MSNPTLLVPFTILTIFAGGVHAQWLNYQTPGTPRTPDGKANLAAPAPRAADGKPDLGGVWLNERTSLAEMMRLFGRLLDARITTSVPGDEVDAISKYVVNILLDFKPEEAPIRPEAAKILQRRLSAPRAGGECLPLGIPANGFISPSKIVQSSQMTVILYESDGTHRQIYTDGRDLPKEIVQPAWLGYSVGHWDGDTLVVESTGFNDKTWLDAIGHPHSEALRIMERYRRRNFGHLDVDMTFDDPQMYTKPFTIKFTQELLADSDIFEYVCEENEKDRAHLERR